MNKDILGNILLSSQQLTQEKAYWTQRLSGELVPSHFAYDYIQPQSSQSKFETVSLKFPLEIADKLIRISNGSDLRLLMVFLTIIEIIYYKYTDKTDVTIAVPTYKQEAAADLINNILILRNQINEDATFKELLYQMRQTVNEANQNQNYPVKQLITLLDEKNHSNLTETIFDNIVMLENIHDPKEVEDLHFSLMIKIIRYEQGIEGEISYNSSLYKQDTLKRIASHIVTVTEAVLINPDITLKEIEILSQSEREEILYQFNDTKAGYPKDKTMVQLFEEGTTRNPENVAVICGEAFLTYRELNEKANQLAWLLREKGVRPDSPVAIMMERSLEMIIGIFGILKAGAAYLPLDPHFPKERIQTILQDSSVAVILTSKTLSGKNLLDDGDCVILDYLQVAKYPASNPPKVNQPNDLIYVIYTSGSTGRPKGVMIEHQAVINRLNWMQTSYPVTRDDVILQKTTYTFDVSVWELFWWSLQGAKVCLLPPEGEKDPQAIIEAVHKSRVTTLHFVPSMLNVFLDYLANQSGRDELSSLRQVFCSGEALPPQAVNRFYQIMSYYNPEVKLYNLYGPTEATVDVSYFNCPNDRLLESIPIGKPIANTKLYILNRNQQLQPVGVPGELYIAGDGVARGYLNNPELTKEKFGKNPFQPEERIYRTGDLACWLPDGNIEFLGRIDHQVKIHGYRIELGEIESRLLQYQTVNEAMVTDWADPGGTKYLCAYLVAAGVVEIAKLQEYLREYLPSYMIPSYFVQLEKMPLTANGKVNRHALPNPKENYSNYSGQEHQEPKDELEKKLAALWSEILGIEKVNTSDNFFDIGGNSILVIKLYARLEQEFPGQLSNTVLFAYPTITKLAGYLREKQAGTGPRLVAVNGMSLPVDFFNCNQPRNTGSEYKFQIKDELLQKLRENAREYGIAPLQLLLGVNIYLFAEISGAREIQIQTLVSETNRVYPLHINLDGIEEYQQLFQRVNEIQQEMLEQDNYYQVEDIGQIIPQKGDFAVVPFFYNRELLQAKVNLEELYDLLFEIDESSLGFGLRCAYNPKRLAGEKIEELMQGYLQLVQLAII